MFLKKIVKVYDNNIDGVKSEIANLQRCSVNFVFYQEDIYIDTLFIPAAKKKWISKLVKNSLIFNFEDIGKLCYSYDIAYKSANKFCIRLYCINSKKNLLFEALNKGVRVVGVYLIQFCYCYYVQRYHKQKEFLLIFNSKGFTYIIFCLGGSLKSSSLFKSTQESFKTILDVIEENIKGIDGKCYGDTLPIVFMNYEIKSHIESLSQYFPVKDLGSVSEEKVVKKYIGAI
jgi:hypothetical protein